MAATTLIDQTTLITPPTLRYLEDSDSDLVLRNYDDPDSFELRFMDQPRPGETLVICYNPQSSPWFGCFSAPTVEDLEGVRHLLKSGDWHVARRSERWASISPETPEPEEDET